MPSFKVMLASQPNLKLMFLSGPVLMALCYVASVDHSWSTCLNLNTGLSYNCDNLSACADCDKCHLYEC